MWMPGLMCDVKRVEYDYDLKQAKVIIKDDGCCNMPECIELIQSIDLDVRVIETFNDKGHDTTYAAEKGVWVSMDKHGSKNITAITRGISIEDQEQKRRNR